MASALSATPGGDTQTLPIMVYNGDWGFSAFKSSVGKSGIILPHYFPGAITRKIVLELGKIGKDETMDFKVLAVLVLAAGLESGGDALVRWGMKSGRSAGFLLGAGVLFLYGLTVNIPKWDFGRLLGVYITLFFIFSQVLGVFVFRETVPPERWWGGALVVAGGICMTLGK